jgi:hypothetical protein
MKVKAKITIPHIPNQVMVFFEYFFEIKDTAAATGERPLDIGDSISNPPCVKIFP